MNNLVPFAMLSAVSVLDSELEGWTLDDPTGEPRQFHFPVTFERPFAIAPLVHVAIAGFDVGNQDAARLRVIATDIQPDGFVIRAETWLSTRIWRIEVSWLAVGTAAT